ncbi:MAG: hypothetical protein P4L43_09985 [Syntrophobacteraceae bacterium]|nr:hypothetical protein [Syntrophobacteraceae bacterium]
MYLTSFIHREELLRIVERWLCANPEVLDAALLTRIFICDGYVLGQTLEAAIGEILRNFHDPNFRRVPIRSKGELRDALFSMAGDRSRRIDYLLGRYRENPEYFFYQTPYSGVLCLDESDRFIGSYRIKRPKRIAEKANRRIASWIFETVRDRAQSLARGRAQRWGVPLDRLITSPEEMEREFIEAEESLAASFQKGQIRFERSSITINDVGGMKVIGSKEKLQAIEAALNCDPRIIVSERQSFHGNYEALSLTLDIAWDPEAVCRKYRDLRIWEKFVNRGIAASELKKGLEPFLENSEERIRVELMLCTPESMVESELGSSMHEERIIAQRDFKPYRGYIPTNVEFLLEYIFAVGFSPAAKIGAIPIKLWGRYLPDTLGMFVRELFELPEYDLFY